MKKKIALLLALIMTISLMPVTIFAESYNRITDKLYNFSGGTQFVIQPNLHQEYVDADTDKERNTSVLTFLEMEVSSIRAKGNVTDSFTLELTNATWQLWYENKDDGTNKKTYYNLASDAAASAPIADNTARDLTTPYEMSASKGRYYELPEATTTANAGNEAFIDFYGSVPFRLATSEYNTSSAEVYILDSYTTGDIIRIPLTIVTKNDNENVYVEVRQNDSAFSEGKYLVVEGRGSGTTNKAKSIKGGTEKISLDTLLFTELRPNIINDGVFEITAPRGYEFNDPSAWTFAVDLGLKHNGGFYKDIAGPSGSTVLKSDIRIYQSNTSSRYDDRESYYVFLNGFDTANRERYGSLILKNVVLYPLNNSSSAGTELSISIREYDDFKNTRDFKDVLAYTTKEDVYGSTMSSFTPVAKNIGITANSFPVAKVSKTGISFSAGAATTLYAGQWDESGYDSAIHKTATVTFVENEFGAWIADRDTTFTLPDGVKIRGIEFDNDKITTKSLTGKPKYDLEDARVERNRLIPNTVSTNNELYFEGNSFTVRAASKDSPASNLARLRFTLFLSIDPNFVGDEIKLSVSGRGIGNEELDDVLIANVKKPITIETKTTPVEIGFQRLDVATITITEAEAGLIQRGADLNISVTDFSGWNDMIFAPITSNQIKIDGDLRVTPIKNSNGIIQLYVDRTSRTGEPSTITISGLEVRTNRNVPYGVYDLTVYGDAVFRNYSYYPTDDLRNDPTVSSLIGFNTWEDGFVFEKYVSITTPGDNMTGTTKPTINSNMKIYPDSINIYVDNTSYKVNPAPRIIDGTTYVPLRAFAEDVLGMVVSWDTSTSTGTIKSDDIEIKVTSNQSTMLVNGTAVLMTNELGDPVVPFNDNGSFLIPLRSFFVDAFGLDAKNDVTWQGYFIEINPAN